ncbi:hypothetical protein F4818DRAFT_55974 [Hypoxylon cercidicola]|nr:hypothetical protein F4818DRAFT_55974 [Hypoxylon cercidicola]
MIVKRGFQVHGDGDCWIASRRANTSLDGVDAFFSTLPSSVANKLGVPVCIPITKLYLCIPTWHGLPRGCRFAGCSKVLTRSSRPKTVHAECVFTVERRREVERYNAIGPAAVVTFSRPPVGRTTYQMKTRRHLTQMAAEMCRTYIRLEYRTADHDRFGGTLDVTLSSFRLASNCRGNPPFLANGLRKKKNFLVVIRVPGTV